MRDYAAVPQGTKLVTTGYGKNVPYTHTEAETEFLQSFQSDDPIFGNVTRGDQIPYVPRHELNVSVGIEHPRFGINGTMTHVAKTRELRLHRAALRQRAKPRRWALHRVA